MLYADSHQEQGRIKEEIKEIVMLKREMRDAQMAINQQINKKQVNYLRLEFSPFLQFLSGDLK